MDYACNMPSTFYFLFYTDVRRNFPMMLSVHDSINRHDGMTEKSSDRLLGPIALDPNCTPDPDHRKHTWHGFDCVSLLPRGNNVNDAADSGRGVRVHGGRVQPQVAPRRVTAAEGPALLQPPLKRSQAGMLDTPMYSDRRRPSIANALLAGIQTANEREREVNAHQTSSSRAPITLPANRNSRSDGENGNDDENENEDENENDDMNESNNLNPRAATHVKAEAAVWNPNNPWDGLPAFPSIDLDEGDVVA